MGERSQNCMIFCLKELDNECTSCCQGEAYLAMQVLLFPFRQQCFNIKIATEVN